MSFNTMFTFYDLVLRPREVEQAQDEETYCKRVALVLQIYAQESLASLVWWCKPATPALQAEAGDREFHASLGYIERQENRNGEEKGKGKEEEEEEGKEEEKEREGTAIR